MNQLLYVDPEQIREVADAANPAAHAPLDEGWTPPPEPDDPWALTPPPPPPSAVARRAAVAAALAPLSAPARRELCAVMDLGRGRVGAADFADSVAAFRDGQVGCDEAAYFKEKSSLAEDLRAGLAALGG